MSAREFLAKRIEEEFAQIGAHMSKTHPVPGHDWRAPSNELRWWAGDVLRSSRHGASVVLQRSVNDFDDPEQLHVELRLFWNDTHYEQRFGVHRAIIWVEQGAWLYGRHKDLLAPASRFVHATSIDVLIDQIDQLIDPAIARYRVATTARRSGT